MKRRKEIISGSLLGVSILGALALTGFAYADFGPNYSPERHEEMLKAFEDKNYETWKSLRNERWEHMQGMRGIVDDAINKDNFDRFIEMRRLRLEGNAVESNEIRNELGLPELGEGKGEWHGHGMGRFGWRDR